MPHRAATESAIGIIAAWLISTTWGRSLVVALGYEKANFELPAMFNAMGVIDGISFIPLWVKMLLLIIGVTLWVLMTLAVIYRGFAGGDKLFKEGEAKIILAKAEMLRAENDSARLKREDGILE